MTVMTAVMRRHGAAIVERNGRAVAAHFGSPVSEAAVCRSHVGLSDRSDRATLELTGAPAEVDAALAALGPLAASAVWVRRSPGDALVRCEGVDDGFCASLLLRADAVTVVDVSDQYAAVDLIGPLAEPVLEQFRADEDTGPLFVLRREPDCIELLTPAAHGPALWNRLLECGEPFEIGCVGVDALEHLGVSDRLDRLRVA